MNDPSIRHCIYDLSLSPDAVEMARSNQVAYQTAVVESNPSGSKTKERNLIIAITVSCGVAFAALVSVGVVTYKKRKQATELARRSAFPVHANNSLGVINA